MYMYIHVQCTLFTMNVHASVGIMFAIPSGTATFPEYGTTNLHLDVSDAVNVMVRANSVNSDVIPKTSCNGWSIRTCVFRYMQLIRKVSMNQVILRVSL